MAIPSRRGERKALGTNLFVFGWKFKLSTILYKFKRIPPACHASVVFFQSCYVGLHGHGLLSSCSSYSESNYHYVKSNSRNVSSNNWHGWSNFRQIKKKHLGISISNFYIHSFTKFYSSDKSCFELKNAWSSPDLP